MPSPALDDRPDEDAYTASMVNAFTYISKGSNEHGMIPVSEIHSYYQMFEHHLAEDKMDFIYLIHQMNMPILEEIIVQRETAKNRR